jgi:hypothetical protein
MATPQVALPAYSSTYSGSARGYFFKVPANMVVTHLQVPDEQNTGVQAVALYHLTAAPPAFSQTVSESPDFFASNVPSNQRIPVTGKAAVFVKNEWIAVLGVCGTGANKNSYAARGQFQSTCLGLPITIARCGIQTNLVSSKGVFGMWSEVNGSPCRVRMWVAGQGSHERYGKSSGITPLPELLPSDPFPPCIGKKAELILKPGSASNTNGLLAISVLRSNIQVGGLTFLNYPFAAVQAVAGPIPAAGTPVSFNVPNNVSLSGFKITFQGAVGVTSGVALTNGTEWILGR